MTQTFVAITLLPMTVTAHIIGYTVSVADRKNFIYMACLPDRLMPTPSQFICGAIILTGSHCPTVLLFSHSHIVAKVSRQYSDSVKWVSA